MTKFILPLVCLLTIGLQADAQTWNGSTVSTATASKAAIGTTTFDDAQLTVRNTGGVVTGTPAPRSLKIVQDINITSAPAIEVTTGSLPIFGGQTFSPTPKFVVDVYGNVNIAKSLRIGTTATAAPYADYALSVDGTIVGKKCVIQITNWADYVFDANYQLKPLEEVEDFINMHKHLPDVPSEAKVLTEGIEMGEMNKILLQKVEELTLYMIELKKENKKLAERIEQIEKN